MALTYEEIRAKIKAQTEKSSTQNSGGSDNSQYQFWNNPDGSTATLRFLPDGNKANDFWWEERLIIKLPFPSIKGQPSSGRPIEVQVPCMDMWKPRSCPITAEISPWWKGGKELEDMAKKYWRKKSYLFQGFVVTNPNQEDLSHLPENPIRRFTINPSVFDRIKTVFLDQEIETSPIDYKNGLDFRLVKGSKGGYADYGASTWARKERALSTEELAAIDTYDLFNLSNFLPKKPDDAHLQAILDMFRDSVDEKPYDPDKYAQFYKPYGLRTDTEASSNTENEKSIISVAKTNISVSVPAADVNDDDVPFDGGKPIKTTETVVNPHDVLDTLLRRRQAQNKS